MDTRTLNISSIISGVILVAIVITSYLTMGHTRAFFLIVGADGAAAVALILFLLTRRSQNRQKPRMEKYPSELKTEYSFLRRVAGVPTKFRYKDLEEATENFKRILGKGESGSVFKGVLRDGTQVAVKRIEGEEQGDKKFRSEVAAIASVQHVNLVHLYGYCSPSTKLRFLVYEFIQNGSLDCWIFPRTERKNPCNPANGGCLSWDLRCRVAIDVAKVLSYLHHDCRSRILHLDIKPQNILLDFNYRAIVSDFGLSKLMPKEESRVMTSIRGTRGYLAPEWLLRSGISEKSDVYSYGMVLLEMIGGRRCIKSVKKEGERKNWEYFPRIVSDKLKAGNFMEVVDGRLLARGKIDEGQVRRMVCVGLWCIQEKARMRPAMADVVEMLEGRAPVDDPPLTKMIIVDILSIEDGNSGAGGVPERRIGDSPSFSRTYSNCPSIISTVSGR